MTPTYDATLEDRQRFVSTGNLPRDPQVQAAVDDAFEHFRTVDEGENAAHYPALARVSRELFGVCITGVSGNHFSAGDADVEFTMMSVSKPFLFALVSDQIGAATVRAKVGVNATGLPFNSLEAVERMPDNLTNPMVNPGAIATTSLVPGDTTENKWRFIQHGLSRFAGRPLAIDEEVFASASATNHRNRDLARALNEAGRLYADPVEAVELYTRQCSLSVSARDLATMAATLANGGRNPVTGDPVISPRICRQTLAVMVTAGLYETSGDWLYDLGLPGKSGVGGGIITVAPGKGGLATFSPPLDEAGNSVRGQLVSHYLSERLGLNLFASLPVGTGA